MSAVSMGILASVISPWLMPCIAIRLNVFVQPGGGSPVAQFSLGDPASEMALARRTHRVDEWVRECAPGISTGVKTALALVKRWGQAESQPGSPAGCSIYWPVVPDGSPVQSIRQTRTARRA